METIVLQETDQDILDILTVALQMEGFEVFSTTDLPDDLLQQIDAIRPHVVMLDYRLNGKESIDMCKRIKARYPHLPVIALSCNYNIENEYCKHGFIDYIKKPFDLEMLFGVLRKHIPKIPSINFTVPESPL